MQFFTMEEFMRKYNEFSSASDLPVWYIEYASEMIFSQIGLRYRDTGWTSTSVPLPIKNASMEQMRFMLEHDIPFIDTNNIEAGSMKATIKSDYSTLALRILSNAGYLYRGNSMMSNMGLNIGFGE